MNKFIALVVDDDEDIRAIAREEFEGNQQIVVVTAGTAKEAKGLIGEYFFNIALIDIQLDGGGGRT